MEILSRLIPRRLRIFAKEYRKSVLFAYSSPISSLFWILSVIPSRESSTKVFLNVPESAIYWSLILLALASIAGPTAIYWWNNRPFHVAVEWYPKDPESIDHRLKRKNIIRLPDGDGEERVAEILVTVYFEKNTEEYRLKLDSDGPLKIVPKYAPGNSNYKSDEDLIVSNNVESPKFFFPLEIHKEDGQSGVLEQFAYLKDDLNGGKTILNVEVI